jgi:hypothetical protein
MAFFVYGLMLFNKSFFYCPWQHEQQQGHQALGFTKTIKDLLFSVFSVWCEAFDCTDFHRF